MEDNNTSPSLTAYAAALADAHARGMEERCRRWRRLATVRRILAGLLLVAAGAAVPFMLSDSLLQPWTEGTLNADDAVAEVHNILMNR